MKALGLVLVLLAAAAAACGPRHLSALGNPGDLCTEDSSCVEGTQCRITEEGYRCVDRSGRAPSEPTSTRPPEGPAEDEAPPGFRPVVDPAEDQGAMVE